jgi:tetratricopeptide (TPR) repeat protein
MMDDRDGLPPELREVDGLTHANKRGQAVRLLKTYLRRFPRDAEALLRMAGCQAAASEHERAIETLKLALEVEPDHLHVMRGLASLLESQGDASEALTYVERAIRVYDALPAAEQRSERAQIGRSLLCMIHWDILRSLGEPEHALQVAREGLRTDSRLQWNVVQSLVELGRNSEAEDLYRGEGDPEEYIQGIKDIAFHLMFADNYEGALPYFQRYLAFAALPREFSSLQAYAECLVLAGHYEEMVTLGAYWLDKERIRWRPYRRILQVLMALGHEGLGDHQAATEFVSSVCQGGNADRCWKLLVGRSMFEKTGELIRELLNGVLGS